MVRATTPSHTVGIVVARNPRRINRRPLAAPRTTSTSSVSKNVLKAFMTVHVRSSGSCFCLLRRLQLLFHFIAKLSFSGREEKSYEDFTIRIENLSDRDVRNSSAAAVCPGRQPKRRRHVLCPLWRPETTHCVNLWLLLGTKEPCFGTASASPSWPQLSTSTRVKSLNWGSKGAYRKTSRTTAKELHATSTSADESK